MPTKLTPQDDRECPIYAKIIDGELCYETAMCMQGFLSCPLCQRLTNSKSHLMRPVKSARAVNMQIWRTKSPPTIP